jgi:hypothetical protein
MRYLSLLVSGFYIESFNLENKGENIKQRDPIRALIYCLDYRHSSDVGNVAGLSTENGIDFNEG